MSRAQKVLVEVACPKCGKKVGIIKGTVAWHGRCDNAVMRPTGERFEAPRLSRAQLGALASGRTKSPMARALKTIGPWRS